MSTVAYVTESTTAAASSSSSSDAVPKSVITICILVAGFVIGVLVAKLVNYCYNRADVPDNASDISEHTKGLLRIQLALLKMGKSSGFGGADGEAGADPEETKRQQQATVLSMWKMKAMNKAAQKAQEETAVPATTVQIVNEADADGNKKGGAAAGGKKGGAAGKAGVNTKPKPFVKPKKLFPNSLSGVAPKEESSSTEARTTSTMAATAATSKNAGSSTTRDKPDSVTRAASSAAKPTTAKAASPAAASTTSTTPAKAMVTMPSGSVKAKPPMSRSQTPTTATVGGGKSKTSSGPSSPKSNA